MGLRTLKQKRAQVTAPTTSGSGRQTNPQNSSTSAQFPSSLGEERLAQNQQQAARFKADYPEFEGNADIRQIEETGFLDKSKRALGGFLQATGLDTALRFIDTPRRLIQLGVMDAFGGDSQAGTEITAGNYWEVATQQDQRLVDRLGAEVVGEYGDLSGSVIFDALGWEKTDNWLNNFVRGSTQFLYDAATDPTTYISFGMAALPKRAALEAAELTVRDAAKAAAKRVAGKLDDAGESALEASMRTQIGAQAETIAQARLEKAILEAGEDALDGTAKSAMKRELFQEAVDEAETAIGDSWTTRVAKPIAERDFVSLPEEYITHYAQRNMTPEELAAAGLMGTAKTEVWTTGGLRFGSPFGKKTFGALPGTRGLGRKVLGNPIRKAVDVVSMGKAPVYRAKRAAKWLEEGTGYEKFLIGLAKEGKHYGLVSRVYKESEAVARELGDDSARLALRQQLNAVTDAAGDLTDGEFDDVLRLAFNGAQNGGVVPEEFLTKLNNPALAAEVQTMAAIGYGIAEKSHDLLGKANIRIGQIHNFTPMRLVREFRENLKVWMQDGSPIAIPVGDVEAMERVARELGNGVTVEDLVIFADVVHHSAPTGAKKAALGDTTSFHQRNLGRTAVATLDDSDMIFINEAGVLPDGRNVRTAYATLDDLNDGLMRVFGAISEKKGIPIAYPTRKSTRLAGEGQIPLRALQDDPLDVWNGYLDSISKAAFEAHLIARSREAGLIMSPDYAEVLDQTLAHIRPALNETPAIVERVIAGRSKALQELGGYKLPRETYLLGDMEVELPKGWRSNRSMRAAVKRYEEQQAKVERTMVQVRKMRDEQAAKILQAAPDMTPEEAMRWATATSINVAELRGAARQEAMDMAVEVTTATHRALLALDEEARNAAWQRAGEVEARVAELAKAHADAMDEITVRYAEKVGDGLPKGTTYTRVGDDGLYDDLATVEAFSAVLANAKAAYNASVDGSIRHVEESIAEIGEQVAEVGSRELLPIGTRRRLEHLERLQDIYVEGQAALRDSSKTASASASEQLAQDLVRVIESGFANLGKPRVAKAIEAKVTAMLQDGHSMSHVLWDDDQFRELLAVGIRHLDGTEIARGLQTSGKRISTASTMRAAEERVDSIIRAVRAEVAAQQSAYEHAAAAASRRQGVGVQAFLEGDLDRAAAHVGDISAFVSEATGRKGGLTMVKVASGKNRDRWIVEWVDDTVEVGRNAPTIAEAAQALRDGKLTPELLEAKNLSEVVWYRDLEDSMQSGLQEAALRAAREDVERVGVGMSPWLDGDYNAYMDRVKRLTGIDTRNTKSGGTQLAKVDERRAAEIADLYDEGYARFVQDGPTPEATAAYEKMVEETVAQYQTIVDDGVRFEIYQGRGEPYKSSAEMVQDVTENKRLKILPTEARRPTGPVTRERAEEILAPNGTATVDDLYALREVDVRASRAPGTTDGNARVDALKESIEREGFTPGKGDPLVVYVTEGGEVFLGDGNHRITALYEMGRGGDDIRVTVEMLDDPVALRLKSQPLAGVEYLQPKSLELLAARAELRQQIPYAAQNPLYRETGIVVDVVDEAGNIVGRHDLLGNDLFRGVHDYYGHSRLGNQFGPSGEETAWLLHSRMYSPEARRAVTTETRGQNSWVNYGKQIRREDGTLPVKGDPDWIHPADREFAGQGMFLLDDKVVWDRRYNDLFGFDAVGPQGPRVHSEAMRVWNDVFSKKIDAALSGRKGAATRLKNAVSQTVNGDVKVSAEWRALEAALPMEEAAKLKALIRNLVLQDEATTPVSKRLLKMNEAEIMHGQSFAPVEATLERLEQVARQMDQKAREAKKLDHIDAIRTAQQLNDTIKQIGSRVAATDANGVVQGVPARLAAMDAAFREELNLAVKLADELGIDAGTRRAARQLKAVKSSTELGIHPREVSRLREHFSEVAEQAQVRGIREGFAIGEARGLGGSLADVDINPHVAIMFENMTDNMRALQTPLGVTMMQQVGHGFMNLWKAQATIARPAFHTRNMISALSNNMIIGVGMKEYREVFRAASRFRDALKKSGSVDEALQAVPERIRPVVSAAWEDHVLQAGFGRAEFRSNVPTRGLSVGKEIRKTVTPWDDKFVLTVAGSSFMTRIEDYFRMAAFHKFYDPDVPASSAFAREMVMAVHFDYANLTAIERKLKAFAPFFVWARRNIPLQMRVMVERPGIANRYAHLMDAVRDNFGGDNSEYPLSPWLNSQATVLGDREESDFWMNFVFDPDLPIVDLESVPMFGEKGLAGTFSPVEWFNFAAGNLGPHVSMPFDLTKQSEFGQVNAPVGLNEVFRWLDTIDFWGGIDVSDQGDVQMSYTTRSIFETLVPFYREYTAGFENDPNRAAKLGVPEDHGVIDVLKGFGVSFGKGFGWQTTAPSDAKGPAYEAQQFLRELRERQQKGIG